MKRINVFSTIALLIGTIATSCNQTTSTQQNYQQPIPLTQKGKIVSCVSFATIPNGGTAVSWAQESSDTATQQTFYFATWQNEQGKFSSAMKIPLEPNASFRGQNKPILVYQTPDSIWVIYSVTAPTVKNKFAGFVHYRLSANGGQTWSPPHSLMNDTIPGKSHSFANAIRLSNGRIAFAWMGGMPDMARIPGRALYFSTSSGNGSFSPEILIDSFACPCCRNSLAVAPNGKVAIVYRSVRKGNIRDIAFAYKMPNQSAFSKPVVFSNDHWKIDACPEDGPSLAVSNNKNWVGWFTAGAKRGLFFAELNNAGDVLQKTRLDSTGRYVAVCKIGNDRNAIIFNQTSVSNGKTISTINLKKSKPDFSLQTPLDTAGYFAANPIVTHTQSGNHLLAAWVAKGQLWYREIQ